MTDIFREVEEEVRQEQFEQIWKEYGDYIIAAAAVVIIAIAGFELWQRYEDGQRAKASAEFNAAAALASANPAAGEMAFEKLAATAPGGYALLSKFSLANTALATGDRAKAVAIYEFVASGDNGALSSAARIRAAWAIADTASKADLQTLVAPLTDPTSAWRFLAREVLAYSDYRAGQLREAQREYQALADDPNTPQALRFRAHSMASLLNAGGTGNFGYVPPPPAPAQSTTGAPPAAASQQGTPSQ